MQTVILFSHALVWLNLQGVLGRRGEENRGRKAILQFIIHFLRNH